MIRQIVNESDIRAGADVVRRSFATVAREFGLTESNCPANAAFLNDNDLLEAHRKGVRMFAYFNGEGLVGFVALEKRTDDLYYLERLAVLPEYRYDGMGMREKLIDYCVS